MLGDWWKIVRVIGKVLSLRESGPTALYKRVTRFEVCHSHVDRCTVMSSEKKLEEIAEDLWKELNDRLVFLSEKVIEDDRSLV